MEQRPEESPNAALPESPDVVDAVVAADKDDSKEITPSATSWSGWSSAWMGSEAASGLLNKAVCSVSSAVSMAKSKSSEAYGLVSKDLEEVSSQAVSVMGSTASSIKRTLEKVDQETDALAEAAVDSVKKSVTSAWRFAAGYAQQLFHEEDLDAEALLVGSEQDPPLPLDRLQAQLLALSADPNTFAADPDPMDDLAQDWSSFAPNLEKRQGEISDLMVTNVNIRRHYTSLVPEKVNHNLFWKRYFYKVYLIEVQESKRKVLKARADETQKSDILAAWDEEGDKSSHDIPEEIQNRLFSEYERELIDKKMKSAPGESLAKEMGQLSLATVAKESSPPECPSVSEKDETSSDDWERLSSGQRSPQKI